LPKFSLGLSFLFTDKGAYYELLLQFRVDGKVFQLDATQVFLLVCAKQKPGLWYLLEAEQDAIRTLFVPLRTVLDFGSVKLAGG